MVSRKPEDVPGNRNLAQVTASESVSVVVVMADPSQIKGVAKEVAVIDFHQIRSGGFHI